MFMQNILRLHVMKANGYSIGDPVGAYPDMWLNLAKIADIKSINISNSTQPSRSQME